MTLYVVVREMQKLAPSSEVLRSGLGLSNSTRQLEHYVVGKGGDFRLLVEEHTNLVTLVRFEAGLESNEAWPRTHSIVLRHELLRK